MALQQNSLTTAAPNWPAKPLQGEIIQCKIKLLPMAAQVNEHETREENKHLVFITERTDSQQKH
jgi:hypothetical protein